MQSLSLNKIAKQALKTIDHSNEKWIKYFLEQKEIDLLRSIKQDSAIRLAKDYLDVDVGIVTGRNKFFMLSQEEAEAHGILDYTQTVVSRSPHLQGISFRKEDLTLNLQDNITSLLFTPPNKPFEELPKACQNYIKFGEENGHNLGYKCRIRKRWYIVPSLGVPDAFALRQINEFPKIVLNKAGSSSTDTIHRVRFLTQHNKELTTLSFLNSLTFAFSEITGRSYGGGVMTFEPTEVEELPLPLLENAIDFKEIDDLMRKKEVRKALNIIDQALLKEQLGMSAKDIKALRAIWDKLSGRRLYRKRKKKS